MLATCEREPLLHARSCRQFGPNPVAAFRIAANHDGIALRLSVREAPAEDLMVFASPPCSPGRASCSIFSFLGLLPAAVRGESDITGLYLKKLREWRKLTDERFQVPLEGSRVFVRVVQQVDGWQNHTGTFRAGAFIPAKQRGAGRTKGRQGGGRSR